MEQAAGDVLQSIGNDNEVSSAEMQSRMLYHFGPFLILYGQKNVVYAGKVLSALRPEEFSIDLFEHFGAYLEHHVQTWGTARVYFGALLCYVKKKFPDTFTLRLLPKSKQWKDKIKKHYVQECHKTRTPLSNHKIPVCERTNKYICDELFKNNRFEEGAIQALEWSNGGRIMEAPGLEWRDLSIYRVSTHESHICCVNVQWFRGKTATLTSTYMFLHANNWQACCLHSLARLIVLRRNPSESVFPTFGQGNLVNRMNTIFKEAYRDWKIREEQSQLQRQFQEDMGIYPTEEPYQMLEGLSSHGNRAACVQRSLNAGIPRNVVMKHCGLSTASGGNDHNYDSVDFVSDPINIIPVV